MGSPHLPDGFDLPDLLPQHRDEWVVGSGVDPAIVELNVTSLAGEPVLEQLIGQRLEDAGGHGHQYVTGEIRNMIHSREQLLLGGWWCEGVDTLNGCRGPAGWGLFKPDSPRIGPDGRERKYEHPLGVPERIVALRMPNPDYWAEIKADPTITIVLDEGGKKAAAWLTAGIAGLALPGLFAGTPPIDPADPEPRIGNGYRWHKPQARRAPKQRHLHPDLKPFAPGRRFVISFDYEPTHEGQQRRDGATRHLVEQLYAAGASEVAIAHRPGPTCKGADDLLVAMGPDALHELLEGAEPVDRGPIVPTYQLQPSTALTGDRQPADLLADHIAERIYSARAWARQTGGSIPAVLDHLTNTPGTGKSHLVPQIGPRLLEIQDLDRVIYVSSTYRSPSIGELNRWAAPPSRHNGLVVENIDGHQRLRRRKKSDPDSAVVEQPSCQYSGKLQRLRDQGTSPDQISHFCHKQCPIRMGCKYLQDQHEFLSDLKGINREPQRLFRCSVESIPTLHKWLGDEAWARTYLIFDEAPQIESAAISKKEITLEQFTAWGAYLRTLRPDAMATPAGQQLTALLDALATLNPADRPHGLQPQELIAHLPPAPDLAEVFGAEPLNPQIDLSGLANDEVVEQISDAPQLLGELIRALRPPTPGLLARAFYLNGTITILSASLDLAMAALSAAGSLVLDGTASTDDINRALLAGRRFKPDTDGARHHNPLAINTPSDLKLANLEIIQIPDLGPMGRNRGADKQRRLEALIPAISRYVCGLFGEDAKTGVLEKSHFRSREAGHGVWFVDNQGSNAYELDRALVMVGCPAPNLTASLTQFQVSRNNPHATLNSQAFRDWYGRRMGEQIIQGLHRLRPIRRPGETLLLFLITSTNLSGLGITTPGTRSTFKQLPASHFTKAAAPKSDRTRDRVISAIQQLQTQGRHPSQRAVAEIAGISKTQVLRQAGDAGWDAFVQDCFW